MNDFIEALKEIKKESKDFQITLSRNEVLEITNEIDRLNNIIKEVIEYIEKEDNQTKRGIYPNYWYEVKVKDILEILNKGDD